MHGNRQQCLIARWLGLSVTVRVRARAKVTKIFVLRVSGNCDIRSVRTTTVRDIKMMYSQERYMENVPILADPVFCCLVTHKERHLLLDPYMASAPLTARYSK